MRYVENSNVNEIPCISKLNLEINGNIGKMYQQKTPNIRNPQNEPEPHRWITTTEYLVRLHKPLNPLGVSVLPVSNRVSFGLIKTAVPQNQSQIF
jgi:hypothetical protein